MACLQRYPNWRQSDVRGLFHHEKRRSNRLARSLCADKEIVCNQDSKCRTCCAAALEQASYVQKEDKFSKTPSQLNKLVFPKRKPPNCMMNDLLKQITAHLLSTNFPEESATPSSLNHCLQHKNRFAARLAALLANAQTLCEGRTD